jgi:hypothetical protein
LNSKGNNEISLQKSSRQLTNRKSNRPLNPKPDGLCRMLFLVLQTDGREGFAGTQLRPTFLSDSDAELAVPLADDSTEGSEEQDTNGLFCTGRFSEDHNGEEWIRCAKYFRWAHTLCAGLEEDFVCETSWE